MVFDEAKGPMRWIFAWDEFRAILSWHESLGLRTPWAEKGSVSGVWAAFIPFWSLFTLAAIPTAILWRRDRRTVKPGCCLTCGYDLRASKKTCPECGAHVVVSQDKK